MDIKFQGNKEIMQFKKWLNGKFEDRLLQESINDKGIMKACFLCGHSGSGKSYTREKITSGSISPRIINTDKFTEYFGVGKDEWKNFKEPIKILAQKQLTLHVNSMLPLFIESTASQQHILQRRFGILQGLGYDLSCVWVNTSLETAQKRAYERGLKPPHRVVSPEAVESMYQRIKKFKPTYKAMFPLFIEVDNDIGELTDDLIIKAYKKVSSFYSSPVKNAFGKTTINRMHEEGYKYIIDLPEYKGDINKLANVMRTWYD
jgi:hypothetical protein